MNSTMADEAFWKSTEGSFGRSFVGSEIYVQRKWQFQQDASIGRLTSVGEEGGMAEPARDR